MRARPHRYSTEEIDWLASQSLDLTYPELTALFNDRFCTDISEVALMTKCNKLGLKRPRYTFFTDEQIAWVKSQDRSLTYSELTELFNKRFGTNLNRCSMSDLCTKRLNLGRSVNKGHFKCGERGALKYKIGDEVIRGGYVWVKVSDETYESGEDYNLLYSKNWKRKSDLIWESANGQIPDGCFLIFLDGNTENCELDNLYLVNRSVHARMCQNHWYNGNKPFVLMALRWCEMYVLVNECKKNRMINNSYNDKGGQDYETTRSKY